jgi:hypothetical protein
VAVELVEVIVEDEELELRSIRKPGLESSFELASST